MLKLYGTRMSRAARSLWALEELGLKYEHVPLNTQGDSRKPEYLKVNPNGHVPALEDDAQVFWESMAVNLYLAEKYGKPPLWPSSAADHGQAYQWSLWVMTEERLRVTRQTQTPHHRAWMHFAEKHPMH
jgi:glutathione S-transferase